MSYTHLAMEERFYISQLKSSVSLREIGRRLGRSHTSISRELKRNGSDFRDLAYRAAAAHDRAQRRQSLARHYRVRTMLPCCGT
jgi:IS30 family transposase